MKPWGMANTFRLTSFLEKLGIKQALYVHQDEAREFVERMNV